MARTFPPHEIRRTKSLGRKKNRFILNDALRASVSIELSRETYNWADDSIRDTMVNFKLSGAGQVSRTEYFGYQIHGKAKFRDRYSSHVRYPMERTNEYVLANKTTKAREERTFREREREGEEIQEAATSVTSLTIATFYLTPDT